MKKYLLPLLLTVCLAGKAQEFEVRAGFNVGGMSPVPLPREIREIESYNPTLALSIEGSLTLWLDKAERWGLRTGLRLENKGMKTEARVKNYGMEIIGNDGNRLSGNWTGQVHTRVRNTYLTFPLSAVYRLNGSLRATAGVYVSYLTDGEFSGQVYDGYLRKDNPTGDRVNFNNGATAIYDFSDQLRRLQWGLQAGIGWQAFRHLNVYANLAWGLNDIFRHHFRTITFSMYPVYLNVGFGYVF